MFYFIQTQNNLSCLNIRFLVQASLFLFQTLAQFFKKNVPKFEDLKQNLGLQRKCFEPYEVLSGEEAFLEAQQLHMPDVALLHVETERTDTSQTKKKHNGHKA